MSSLPLVRVARPELEPSSPFFYGYIAGESTTLVMLHRIDDSLRLDGYEVFRKSDVTALDSTFDKKLFYERVAQLKKFAPLTPPGIDLTAMPSLLRSVQSHFPLLVIHRERIAPDECEVGQLKLSGDGSYSLALITPEAAWESEPRRFRYDDVTRVGFGAEYEDTLARLAGVAV